jgi:hypothetical protein
VNGKEMVMKTALEKDEKVIRKGMASLQKGLETVGGHLYLTDKRLVFESHWLNFQRGVTQIDLDDITGLAKGTTWLLGRIPTLPNAFVAATKDGTRYRLTVWKREQWISAIKQAQA